MRFVGEWHRKGEENLYGEPDFSWNALRLTEGRGTTLETFQKGRPTMVQTEANFCFFKSPWTQIFLICVWSKV